MKNYEAARNYGAKILGIFLDNVVEKELFDSLYLEDLERIMQEIDEYESEILEEKEALQYEVESLKYEIYHLEYNTGE